MPPWPILLSSEDNEGDRRDLNSPGRLGASLLLDGVYLQEKE